MTKQLVFLDEYIKAEPYTTSEIIAEFAGITHNSVQRLISKRKTDLEKFGKVGFEIRPLTDSKTEQKEKIFLLNDPQATLLITYLKNTDAVRAFKIALVKAFYEMRTELLKRATTRQELKKKHKSLAETVKSIPAHPNSVMDYINYNNLIYRLVFGCTAEVLRKQRGAGKDAVASDYLTSDEMEKVADTTDKVCLCIEIGMPFSEIKARLNPGDSERGTI